MQLKTMRLFWNPRKSQHKFTGTCSAFYNPDPDVVSFYDAADDPRVTRVYIWVSTVNELIDELTTEIAWTAEIFVGAETAEDVTNEEYAGK